MSFIIPLTYRLRHRYEPSKATGILVFIGFVAFIALIPYLGTSKKMEEYLEDTQALFDETIGKANLNEQEQTNKQDRYIPSHVRREVWRRDQGRCAKCGSRSNLEFDHVIPVSKGGGSTARNIELLCQSCNRSKHNKII